MAWIMTRTNDNQEVGLRNKLIIVIKKCHFKTDSQLYLISAVTLSRGHSVTMDREALAFEVIITICEDVSRWNKPAYMDGITFTDTLRIKWSSSVMLEHACKNTLVDQSVLGITMCIYCITAIIRSVIKWSIIVGIPSIQCQFNDHL